MWYSGRACTTQSTRMPGTLTWRAGRLARSHRYSTWAITMPPEFLTAVAIASVSCASASRSIDRLPSGSAIEARMKATWGLGTR